MMSKLCNFKKIGCCAGHNFTGTVCIVKTKRQLFQLIKNIASHILFYTVTKNVAPVGNKPVTHFMNTKTNKQDSNKNQKSPQLIIWNERIERISGKHRKRNINCSHKKGAEHIGNKKSYVRLVIREKDF